jgi:hypothetical protein
MRSAYSTPWAVITAWQPGIFGADAAEPKRGLTAKRYQSSSM